MSNFGAFQPIGNTVAIAATAAASTAVQVPGPVTNSNLNCYLITVVGSNPAFIAFGGSGVSATLPTAGSPGNAFCVPPNIPTLVQGPPNAYVSTICAATQTATVYVTPGEGGAH